ncbi:hypothetical protein D3C81_1030120 [compost metagenome]
MQAAAVAGEVDFHDDGRRVALGHGPAKGRFTGQRQGGEAEELQLARQPVAALGILQGQVDRLAQQRQGSAVGRIVLAQAGTRQALHQAVELADQRAVEAPAIGADRLQALLEGHGQLGVSGLLEALGVLPQALAGRGQLGHVAGVPFAALQALPDLQDVARLVDHPLGEMLFQAIPVGIFVVGHPAGSLADGVAQRFAKSPQI